jgi:hypothetical protein
VGTIAPAGDGLWTRCLDVAAGDSIAGSDPASGGGQFWLVLAGSMRHDAMTLPPRSCLFVHPEEAPLTAVAGADGLKAMAMQFPRRP